MENDNQESTENTVENKDIKIDTRTYVSVGIQTDTDVTQEEEPNILYRPPKTPPKHLCLAITTNWLFFGTLIGCVYALSTFTNHSFHGILLTIFFISMLGYFIHMIGHHISFSKIYEPNDNYVTRTPFLHSIVTSLASFLDFHDTIHHDTSINKQPMNVIYEFINNFVLQGGLILLLILITSYISKEGVFLWASLYATVHNINYIIMPPKTHQNHHANKHSSYGIDIWDVIFNTKEDPDEIESYNHMSINMALITLGIYYYYKHYAKQ